MLHNYYFLILFKIVFVVSCTLHGQTVDSVKLHIPKYSIQFRVVENLGFREFQGSLFSGKIHISDTHALRAGIGINSGKYDQENTSIKISEKDRTFIHTETSTSSETSITLQYLRYFNLMSESKFFAGAGPFWNFYKSDSESEITGPLNYSHTFNQEHENHDIGLEFVLGGEYFFRKKLSVLGEYHFKTYYSYQKSDQEAGTDEYDNSTSKLWYFKSGGVRFGITIYF